MLLNYYTIRALALEWSEVLVGATLTDAYSAARDELTLQFRTRDEEDTAIRISVKPGLAYAFRQEGSSRPRRNVTALFRSVHGRRVSAVACAERDRVLDLQLDDGRLFRAQLFGSRANVFLGDSGGLVEESFREKAAERELPPSRPAPDPESASALRDRWPPGAQPIGQAVFRAVPLFDRELAAETEVRAALGVSDACLVEDFDALYAAVEAVRLEALRAADPAVHREGRSPVALTLVRMTTPPAPETERFDSVDEAVRSYVRATLAERSFRSRYDPLLRDVETADARAAESLAAMRREIGRPSRADRYERWGHLLMAQEAGAPAGRTETTVEDLFDGGDPVRIPLDAALTGLENANRLYDRARRSRRAREEAERRVNEAERRALEAADLLARLRGIEDVRALKAFLQDEAAAIRRVRGGNARAEESTPFRRYVLDSGDVVLVGRNAKQNDELTFRHASKHDLWLHARGVSGSHTVLRRTGKKAMPPRPVLEEAASIAAYHSKARGSALVPVIVTERKYVRSPRKAPPGAVLVEREEVLIVPPRLPASSTE